MGFFSGSELQGSVVEPPSTWQFEKDGGFAEFETRPEDPYSVNLAYVQIEGRLYVYAGDTRTNWVQHIEKNPLVRIRIDEVIYPVKAVRVHDDSELRQFASVWAGRSVFQRDPMQVAEVWLYRLEKR